MYAIPPPVAGPCSSLGALLGTAATEVDALSGVADRLHSLIARHIAREDAPEESIEDAQMIDYLTQHLADGYHLSDEQRTLALAICPEWAGTLDELEETARALRP